VRDTASGTDDRPVLRVSASSRGPDDNVYELPVPRFVGGEDKPADFGGFWVEVPGGVERP